MAPKEPILGVRTDVDQALKERLKRVSLTAVLCCYRCGRAVRLRLVDMVDCSLQAKDDLDEGVIDTYAEMMAVNDTEMSSSDPDGDY